SLVKQKVNTVSFWAKIAQLGECQELPIVDQIGVLMDLREACLLEMYRMGQELLPMLPATHLPEPKRTRLAGLLRPLVKGFLLGVLLFLALFQPPLLDLNGDGLVTWEDFCLKSGG
ncbi:hypothetical protein, partial [Rhodoblastus acidophilus]|uniref:hypothetical protein n=1 Tax=Rhodoblastus acidophilus TaxID=1074 RepID=UPI002224EE5A